jgi:hypothetical protein
MSRPPKVFISYSYDSVAHKDWVRKLAEDLISQGVNAKLDQWDLQPGQDTVLFMEQGITESDRVILVCSKSYTNRANRRKGGVGFEGLIITGEIVSNIDTKKFIPVIRGNDGNRLLPLYLGSRLYIDFRKDSDYTARLEELAREIHQKPAMGKPPLGPNPYATSSNVNSAPKVAPALLVPGGSADRAFNDNWFNEQRERSRYGLKNAGLSAAMEVSFALSDSLQKKPTELLTAAHDAQVHTFGWPLGVVLGNREEYRPKPTANGILAEISLEDRSSYDYWALSNSGNYHLLSSLFEDTRKPNKIFFDTRTIRTTEAFMLCDRLYRGLGLKDDAVLAVRIVHTGLKGRTLTSASLNRHVIPETTWEDQSETTIVLQMADLRAKMVENVTQVLEPMFTLFNYKKIDSKVYEELVINYVEGRVV